MRGPLGPWRFPVLWRRLGTLLLVGVVAGLTVVGALRVLGPVATEPPGTPVLAEAPAPLTPGDLSPEERIVIGGDRKASPAVVHIASVALAYDFFFNVVPQTGTGSGFILDEQGHIVTNNHVVADARSLEVTLADGTKIPATLVGRDPNNDLAVIKINLPGQALPVLPLGDSDALQVGQLAIAIGNPFGLDRTVTRGVISSLNRSLKAESGREIRGIIQTAGWGSPGSASRRTWSRPWTCRSRRGSWSPRSIPGARRPGRASRVGSGGSAWVTPSWPSAATSARRPTASRWSPWTGSSPTW
ncbi:MAG: trypsin-like peptidase domain-containing protein, partial [candidate division NC10 bacterium]|nr:trypsin-like peptidase domain-containing protein [candidate division NC10 bacterium]